MDVLEASSPRLEALGEADRPSFHVMPRIGWLNDPNGLVFYKGRYHV